MNIAHEDTIHNSTVQYDANSIAHTVANRNNLSVYSDVKYNISIGE